MAYCTGKVRLRLLVEIHQRLDGYIKCPVGDLADFFRLGEHFYQLLRWFGKLASAVEHRHRAIRGSVGEDRHLAFQFGKSGF